MRKNDTRGFTLAEVLLVVAITTVLGVIAGVGVSNYKDRADLAKMNSTAKEIFLSASNNMAELDRSSKLDAAGTKDKKYLGTQFSEGDDEKYILIHNAKGNSDEFIKELLPTLSMSTDVTEDGNYAIVYDYINAAVTDVWYTEDGELNVEKVKSFSNEQNTDDILTQDGFIVGYYGDNKKVKVRGARLNRPDLEVKNGEELQIVINNIDANFEKLKKKNKGVNIMSYTMVIEGVESKKKKAFKFEVVRDEAGAITVNGPGKTASALKGAMDDKKANTKNDAAKKGDLEEEFNPVVEKDEYGKKIVITLDSYEKGLRFNDICKDFIYGEDIVCEISCKSKNIASAERKSKVQMNSLFESVIDGDAENNAEGVKIANVGTVRHLRNLDKPDAENNAEGAEDSSAKKNDLKKVDAEGKKDANVKDFTISEVNIIKDLNTEDPDDNAKKIADGDVNPSDGEAGIKNDDIFAGIKNDDIRKFHGNNHTIENLKIKGKDSDISIGLFKEANNIVFENLTVKNIIIEESSENSKNQGAFIGNAKGVVEFNNCKLEGGSIKGNANASGFVGNADGSVTINKCDVAKAEVTSEKMSGGFVGNADNTDGKVNIENCKVLESDISGDRAGGFVGSADSEIDITSCYVYAGSKADELITADNSSDKSEVKSKVYGKSTVNGIFSAGGFVGSANGNAEIKDSKIFTEENEINKNNIITINTKSDNSNVGGFVGGFVGFSNDNSKLTLNGDSAKVKVEGNRAGGLIGCANGETTIYDAQVKGFNNEPNINGVCAGGLIGGARILTITNSHNEAFVNGSANTAGGIAGTVTASCTLENVYNAGTVTGVGAGGLIGTTEGNVIANGNEKSLNVYNVGTVTGDKAGGIAGTVTASCTLENVYNLGSVTGDKAGSIAGTVGDSCKFKNVKALYEMDNLAVNEFDVINEVIPIRIEEIPKEIPGISLPEYNKNDKCTPGIFTIEDKKITAVEGESGESAFKGEFSNETNETKAKNIFGELFIVTAAGKEPIVKLIEFVDDSDNAPDSDNNSIKKIDPNMAFPGFDIYNLNIKDLLSNGNRYAEVTTGETETKYIIWQDQEFKVVEKNEIPGTREYFEENIAVDRDYSDEISSAIPDYIDESFKKWIKSSFSVANIKYIFDENIATELEENQVIFDKKENKYYLVYKRYPLFSKDKKVAILCPINNGIKYNWDNCNFGDTLYENEKYYFVDCVPYWQRVEIVPKKQ